VASNNPGLWQAVDTDDPVIAAGIERLRTRMQRELTPADGLAGWKVGWNDRELRARFGISSGVVGYLRESSTGAFATWSLANMSVPLAEIEIAISLGGPIRSADADDEVLGAINGVAPAVEVLDVTELTPVDAIGTNLWHRAAILGQGADLQALEGPLSGHSVKNVGQPHPLPGLETFKQDLPDILRFVADGATKLGQRVEPGHIVLCGNLARSPIPIRAYDTLHASFGPVGDITINFTTETPP
jgi:2-keto-4-pentenoate hydratase